MEPAAASGSPGVRVRVPVPQPVPAPPPVATHLPQLRRELPAPLQRVIRRGCGIHGDSGTATRAWCPEQVAGGEVWQLVVAEDRSKNGTC